MAEALLGVKFGLQSQELYSISAEPGKLPTFFHHCHLFILVGDGGARAETCDKCRRIHPVSGKPPCRSRAELHGDEKAASRIAMPIIIQLMHFLPLLSTTLLSHWRRQFHRQFRVSMRKTCSRLLTRKYDMSTPPCGPFHRGDSKPKPTTSNT